VSAERTTNAALDNGRALKRTIEARQRQLTGGANSSTLEGIVATMTGIVAYMQAHLSRFKAAAQTFTTRRDNAAQYLRAFQLDHGLRRPASKPDLLMAILQIMFCGLTEGAMAAALMVGEGSMLPVQGLMFGMVFAFINIAVAITGSFYGLRFGLNTKATTDSNNSRDFKRVGGWACFGISLLIVTLLVVTAARVRAVGSHHNIFSWDKVSFLQGFNDGFAVALLALVIVSSFIAYAKGYSGFSDPVPGYTKARREVEDDIIAEINALREQYEQDVDDAFEAVEDQALDTIDDAEAYLEDIEDDLSALIQDIAAHNDALESAKDMLRQQADIQARNYEAVTRQALVVVPDLELEAFDVLRLEPPASTDLANLTDVQSQVTHIRAALAELTQTHSDTIAGIADAHGAFLAASPDLDVISPPTGV